MSDERAERINKATHALWVRVQKMTVDHQHQHFFWPDYLMVSDADRAVLETVFGYWPVTVKIAGVPLIPQVTHVGGMRAS